MIANPQTPSPPPSDASPRILPPPPHEAIGSVRRALSVIKKRTGAHEATIREYRIDNRGLTIGGPLDGFQGVLRGVPVYVGDGKPLLEDPIS
jgi:hypothetical protein